MRSSRLLALLGVLAAAALSSAQPAPSSAARPAAETGWWGAWKLASNSRFWEGTLEIRETTPNGVEFSLDVRHGAQLGSLGGHARFTGPGVAVFTDPEGEDGECRVVLRKTEEPEWAIQVKASRPCLMFAGSGVHFDGEYEAQYDGVAGTELLSETELGALWRAMGPAYERLADAFHVVTEEDTAGAGGARAFAGWVLGAASDLSGIVAKTAEGEVWAAYVDEDEVHAYSTGRAGAPVPAIVERWRAQYPERALRVHRAPPDPSKR